MKLSLTINGAQRALDVAPLKRLIDVLRDDLGLTGTKEGCGEGECGTCTVLVDGDPMNACLIPIGQCEGRTVTTVEGIVDADKPGAFERALIDRGAVQCGFCTPGMVVAAHALLVKNPKPTELEIREAMAGNICRCTGYKRIVEAVQAVAASGEVRR
jgi:aerobic carbon-monoxide dehydrogenase small subunit